MTLKSATRPQSFSVAHHQPIAGQSSPEEVISSNNNHPHQYSPSYNTSNNNINDNNDTKKDANANSKINKENYADSTTAASQTSSSSTSSSVYTTRRRINSSPSTSSTSSDDKIVAPTNGEETDKKKKIFCFPPRIINLSILSSLLHLQPSSRRIFNTASKEEKIKHKNWNDSTTSQSQNSSCCLKERHWKKKQAPIILLPLLTLCILLLLLPLNLKQMLPTSSIAKNKTASNVHSTNTTRTKTTLVIMGYSTKRLENYKIMFPAYGDMEDVLDQVIFLWNNQQHPPPSLPIHSTSVPMHVIPQKENSMNNRFGPDVTRLTKTQCVTMVDDDVLLSEGLIRSMIDAWEGSSSSSIVDAAANDEKEEDTSRRPIVGVDGDSRLADIKLGYLYPCYRWEAWVMHTHCWNPMSYLTSTFSSSSSGNSLIGREPNLVIGKTMTFSTRHLREYQNDEEVWQYTSPEGGHYCEDIIMNALVRNATKLVYSGEKTIGGTAPKMLDPIFVRNDKKILSQSGNIRGVSDEKVRQSQRQASKQEQIRYILNESGGLSFKGLSLRGLYESAMWQPDRGKCVGWAGQHYGDNIWDSA